MLVLLNNNIQHLIFLRFLRGCDGRETPRYVAGGQSSASSAPRTTRTGVFYRPLLRSVNGVERPHVGDSDAQLPLNVAAIRHDFVHPSSPAPLRPNGCSASALINTVSPRPTPSRTVNFSVLEWQQIKLIKRLGGPFTHRTPSYRCSAHSVVLASKSYFARQAPKRNTVRGPRSGQRPGLRGSRTACENSPARCQLIEATAHFSERISLTRG